VLRGGVDDTMIEAIVQNVLWIVVVGVSVFFVWGSTRR
jgi:hypothetical protein